MDFTLFQGDTKRINFALKRADGSLLDVTGATIRWQASKLKGQGLFSSTPSLSKDTANGIEVVDAFSGLVTVVLDPADTVSISGDFYAELETVDATGDVATVYSGQFQIKKALIKPIV